MNRSQMQTKGTLSKKGQPSTIITKDNDGFEDLDTFWKLSITNKNAFKVKTTSPVKKSTPTLSVKSTPIETITTPDVDFNYDDTDSITEDEYEHDEEDGKSARTIEGSERLSSATLNSTLPLEDSIITGNRLSVTSRDSITSEIEPLDSMGSRKRGRPAKKYPSNLSPSSSLSPSSPPQDKNKNKEKDRDGAQAPIGFSLGENVTKSSPSSSSTDLESDKNQNRSSSSSSSSSRKLDNSPSDSNKKVDNKTPKSSLKQKNSKDDKNDHSTSHQVSFDEKISTEKSKKSSISPSKGLSEPITSNSSSSSNNTKHSNHDDYDNYYDNDDYSGGVDDHNSNNDNDEEEIMKKSPNTKKTPSSSRRSSSSLITPATSRGISTPGSYDFTRGVLLDDPNDENDVYKDDGEDTDEEDLNETFVSETSFNQSLLKKAKSIDLNEDNNGTRRSRRVTKGQKFEYWKNERPVYDQGDLVGLMIAVPTPAKKPIRTVLNTKKSNKTKLIKLKDSGEESAINTKEVKKRLRQEEKEQERDQENEVKPPKLPKGVKYIDREDSEELYVWSDVGEKVEIQKCVSHRERLEPLALQAAPKRPPGKDKVGLAAHMFNISEVPNMSDWISGFVELPPGAIKDAEGTGDFVQVFFIADCQDMALELAIADPRKTDWNDEAAQRQLLKKGDSFYVPPGNIYRLENHSSWKTAVMNWVIIRPIPNMVE